MLLNKEQAQDKINQLSAAQKPFFFLIDFEEVKCQVYEIDDIPDNILFDINKRRNFKSYLKVDRPFFFDKNPISFEAYQMSFNHVLSQLNYGNSFLLNLTHQTEIHCDLNLQDIFYKSQAPYKLYLDNECVAFSPETFIKIIDGQISSYPMKGTIDASIPFADQMVIHNDKEKAEHLTIVDLIRNDLSIYASQVTVPRFRYIDRIHTQQKDLLQVSSKIIGTLPDDYRNYLGDILFSLLPAGSISGAPKKKTVEIIQEVENTPRGYYSGIMGLFDGKNLDSGVIIRYIEEVDGQKYYRSGGGITHKSQVQEEYQEMIDKVYLPFK